MLRHLIAIATFALLCGAWVVLQRWIARRTPDVKGPETSTGCGACSCGKVGECKNEPKD